MIGLFDTERAQIDILAHFDLIAVKLGQVQRAAMQGSLPPESVHSAKLRADACRKRAERVKRQAEYAYTHIK